MIHVLDTRFQARPNIIAATALETNGGLALFDTGPESTFDNLSEELEKIGASPRDVRHVFLSHIHLDHAGAAWRFAETGATVYVHPRGAPHLLDPTKLISSATRIYGEQMKPLWGDLKAISPERLRVLQDGDSVEVSPFQFRAHATPGHATHHHVYTWDDHLFGGDVSGVRIGNGPPVPPFVPPELQIEDWLASLEKMRGLGSRQLYLPHFGHVAGPLEKHFDALEKRIRAWKDWFRDLIRAGAGEPELRDKFATQLARELSEEGATRQEVDDYELADPSFMAVSAATRYWQKFNPREIGTAPE